MSNKKTTKPSTRKPSTRKPADAKTAPAKYEASSTSTFSKVLMAGTNSVFAKEKKALSEALIYDEPQTPVMKATKSLFKAVKFNPNGVLPEDFDKLANLSSEERKALSAAKKAITEK